MKKPAAASTNPAATIRVLGVRHHGPGSARAVRQVLERLRPDIVLIEGPPDANDLIPQAAHPELVPPVALLVYRPDQPQKAAFYPFAEFSPEWQAIQVGLALGAPVRFIDLAQAHQLVDQPADDKAAEEVPREDPIRRDPLQWLAETAGYDNGERWWEHLVEHQRDDAETSRVAGDFDVFAAISEAMAALRAEREPERRETLREASMRQAIREAIREGFVRIAVVCGAWHAPALELAAMRPVREDSALLKGLPKVKVGAAWVPWTHGRLCRDSGYGAGIESPGWYQHLWAAPDQVVVRWLTKVARLLRAQDLDASSAHAIEAARLAEAMAALHGRRLPDLSELNDAVQAVFCFGDALPMRLIHDKLIVGETLGKVPADARSIPLQQDLAALQRRLKLLPVASLELKTLDLRKPNDLERSQLLHRLGLLGIPWGELFEERGKGTFKEGWQLQWQPEFAIRVIEAAVWGNTVREAASARARDQADQAVSLPDLTRLLDRVILSDLADAVHHIMERIREESAIASDIAHLMTAFPPLSGILRYGNVRETDTAMVAEVVGGLLVRIAIGLPAACFSLNDEAANEIYERINQVDAAISLIEAPELRATWQEALVRLLDQPGLHGLVGGRATRLLLDAGQLSSTDAARRLSFAVSGGSPSAGAAAWVEGLLKGSAMILLHDDLLWSVLDDWVGRMSPDMFPAALPLLRRTFSTFSTAERRQMGQRVSAGSTKAIAVARTDDDLNIERAESVLQGIAELLGIPGEDRV